jgi:hypothetical protein
MTMNVPQVTPGRIAFLKRGLNFLGCKDCALTALKRGDREGARFWASQARVDWALLANPPTTRLS